MATAVASLEAPASNRGYQDDDDQITPAPQPFSGCRKAAMLLTFIGNQASAAILHLLTDEEVKDITREITVLPSATEDERQAVLHDFVTKVEHPDTLNVGGIEYATSVLVAAYGAETGKRMAERLFKPVTLQTADLDALRRADPQQLAKIVHNEHPQTIALILCHLGTTQAAKLLGELSAPVRSDVARRMAALDQISPEVVNRIAKIIGGKVRLAGESNLESYGGVRAVAEVLNHVETATTEEILESIGSEDEALGTAIRQLMFVFEDLLNVTQDSMRALLGRVDRKVLTTALKGGSPKIKAHFTSLMSGRAKEMLEEDLQALGPVRIRDVEEAQQKIIAVARQLQAEGVISLSAGAEQYVE